MGYYTHHNLKIKQIDKDMSIAEIEELKRKIDNYIENHEDIDYAVGPIDSDWECDSCKWYDHNEDMLEMSKAFPDVVFELEGDGEESGDIWKTYYKNGKSQECPVIMTFDEYDPNKLKGK